MIENFYILLLLAMATGLLWIAIAGVLHSPGNPKKLRVVTGCVVLVNAACQLISYMLMHNVLIRDILCSLAFAVLGPLLVYSVNQLCVRYSIPHPIHGLFSAVTAFAIVIAYPLVALLIHCTSGDCI